MMRKSEWLTGAAFVAMMALLPLLGHWSRRGAAPTCAYDGAALEPLYRVRIVNAWTVSSKFCCIRCAELWQINQLDPPKEVFVADETGGAEIDARVAIFVRSPVVTTRTTGNRIHAFKNKSDAEAHVQAWGGFVLAALERPFR